LIKNSQPFGGKIQKTVGGWIFFDSHCSHKFATRGMPLVATSVPAHNCQVRWPTYATIDQTTDCCFVVIGSHKTSHSPLLYT